MSGVIGGKGNGPRPFSISKEKYSENWDRIFGKTKVETPDSELTKINNKNRIEDISNNLNKITRNLNK